MKRYRIISLLFIFMMVFSTTFIVLVPAKPEEQKNAQPNTSSPGFYDDIGQIYNAETDDRITIKVLRYHPEGKTFNDGDPILLFPGIIENINQFLVRSTPKIKQYYNPQLPTNLEPWAQDPEVRADLEEDPMRYYSIAYYLWSQGYDPWFANYRGIGYEEMRSEDAGNDLSLDDFGLYDMKAAVKKVNEVTGKAPYIGGHSTGGLAALMYLEGCKYGWTGHVKSDANLVKERNGKIIGSQTVTGFIGLDPAWIPGMTELLDNGLIWTILEAKLKIEVRSLLEAVIDYLPGAECMIDIVVDIITNAYGSNFGSIMSYLLDCNTDNIGDAQLFYFLVYGTDALYTRSLSHYLDFIAHDVVREFFKNGWFNGGIIEPPEPGGWFDFYYYYSDNVDKVSVPTIIFLAEEENDLMDLVDGGKVVSGVYNEKTRNVNDELYWITGAHIDCPTGLAAPAELFTRLGNWLAKV